VEAIKLGPFVIPLVRAFVALALAGFVLSAELLARKGPRALSAWAWNAVLIGLVGARLGYVLGHLAVYREDPLSALYLWQGGFSPWAGVLAGALYTLYFFQKERIALRWALGPSAVGGLVALLLFGLLAQQSRMAERLPGWAFPTPEGSVISLAEFSGRPVVVNVWASWCPPCRREMPLLAEYAAKEEEIVFVFANSGENAETVRAFLKREGIELPNVLLDTEGRLVRRLRVVALPTTIFFDREGKVVARHLGELSRAALEDYLKKLR